MIKYALACDHAHEFEGWFGSSEDYDAQSKNNLLSCPVCNSQTIRKQIMAPAVAGVKSRDIEFGNAQVRGAMMEVMGKMRRHVEDNFDYVGDAFAKEARDIHEGKSEDRGIYGEASPKDVKALVEDGIKVAPLPPKPPRKDELN